MLSPEAISGVLDRALGVESTVLFTGSGVGKRHRTNMVRDPSGRWATTLEQVRKKMGTGCLLALIGNRGSGKTQMAAHLIRDRVDSMPPPKERVAGPPRMVRAMEFFLDLRACYRTAATQSERDALKTYASPSLLVIDEAHERGESDWENRMLTHLIDRRYSEMLDTILIANLTEEPFKKSMGPSIISRLQETGGIVVCNWPSFRTAAKGE